MELPVNYDETHYKKRKLVREEYTRVQGGKCYHCGQPLDNLPAQAITEMPIDRTLFPIGFFKNPVHLHHSHDTGLTIGSVHAHCNANLWVYHNE